MECFETVKSHKKIWIIVLAAAVFCFICCLCYFFIKKTDYNYLKEIQSIAYDTDKESTPSDSTDNYIETPVNFTELQKQNPDIYAWINIPGTVIDYPILRSDDDNSYYLEHTVDGKRSAYGSIYTEYYNDKEFGDFNTLIYGHNMKNGTMFGSLKKYRDRTFFEENQYINIYMPGRIMKYRIFAAYVYDDRHILLSFDFDEAEVRSSYLDMIFSTREMSANIDNSVKVTEDDKIITLSTCTSNDEERYLVQAVLEEDSRDN